jgi:hypothetical protein
MERRATALHKPRGRTLLSERGLRQNGLAGRPAPVRSQEMIGVTSTRTNVIAAEFFELFKTP